MQSLKVSKIHAKAGISILVVVALLFGCSSKTFRTEDGLLSYIRVEKNGYIHHKSVNGYNFTLMYRPTDLLVKQELGDSVIKSKLVELREKYDQYLYFNLSMSRNNQELLSTVPKDRNEFGAMVNQLAFGMSEKVHLYTEEKDTIEIADFIYPRMYGMSQSTTIMFVYPRKKKALESRFLNFTLGNIGLHTGEVRFKIDTKKLINEPNLLFKE